MLAYVFGRRKDEVFLQLKELLDPFGIRRFYTDGWGAYTRHLDGEQHQVGKEHTQKIESKHIHIPPNLVVGRVRRIPIPSRGEDLQIEHPV